MNPSIVALLTDFGHRDIYVGVMKGVILSINRDVQFIDLCHECPPGSINEAAFLLFSAWRHLPRGTVVLSVVDPGVGSSRREIIAMGDGVTYVGPDNGTISMVNRFYPITESYRADPAVLEKLKGSQSATFHGRDLFAPLAALLTLDELRLNEECDPVLIDHLAVKDRRRRAATGVDGHVDGGVILHVDGFGNLVTSFHIDGFDSIDPIESLIVETKVGPARFDRIGTYFSEVASGEPIVYVGSTGFIEIAARDSNAAERWNIEVDDQVEINLRE